MRGQHVHRTFPVLARHGHSGGHFWQDVIWTRYAVIYVSIEVQCLKIEAVGRGRGRFRRRRR